MSTPHKFADVIKAWADGRAVQYCYDSTGDWCDYAHGFTGTPDFCAYSNMGSIGIAWRIKPEPVMLKYRRYITGKNSKPYVDTLVEHLGSVSGVEHGCSGFIRWIDTEWQEVEL